MFFGTKRTVPLRTAHGQLLLVAACACMKLCSARRQTVPPSAAANVHHAKLLHPSYDATMEPSSCIRPVVGQGSSLGLPPLISSLLLSLLTYGVIRTSRVLDTAQGRSDPTNNSTHAYSKLMSWRIFKINEVINDASLSTNTWTTTEEYQYKHHF